MTSKEEKLSLMDREEEMEASRSQPVTATADAATSGSEPSAAMRIWLVQYQTGMDGKFGYRTLLAKAPTAEKACSDVLARETFEGLDWIAKPEATDVTDMIRSFADAERSEVTAHAPREDQ